MKLHWYLIPSDGPFPWRPEGRRAVDFGYLRQLAGAIDQLGFEGALVAGGGAGHDLWTFSAFLAAHTRRMTFIIAQHPGQTSPLFMAQKAATFVELSSGRLIINVVNGGETVGPPHGVFLAHDERYEMADEYWGLWSRIVGDPETVAKRLREYEAFGFGTFILSAYPLLEEAYRFADLVLPLLREPSPEASPSRLVAGEFAGARSS